MIHICPDEINAILAGLGVVGQFVQSGLIICRICIARLRALRG